MCLCLLVCCLCVAMFVNSVSFDRVCSCFVCYVLGWVFVGFAYFVCDVLVCVSFVFVLFVRYVCVCFLCLGVVGLCVVLLLLQYMLFLFAKLLLRM